MQIASKQQLRLLILNYQKKQNWKNQKKKKKNNNNNRSNCNWQTVEAATTYPEIHENKKNEVAIINKHENCAKFFLLFYFLKSRSNLQLEWRKWDFENKRFGEDHGDFCSDGEEDGKKSTHTHTHTQQTRQHKRDPRNAGGTARDENPIAVYV